MLESIVVNMLFKEKSLPADFMPDFLSSEDEREEKEQLARNKRLLEKVQALNLLFGGSDERGIDSTPSGPSAGSGRRGSGTESLVP